MSIKNAGAGLSKVSIIIFSDGIKTISQLCRHIFDWFKLSRQLYEGGGGVRCVLKLVTSFI